MRIVARARVAGVEDAPGARRDRCVDRSAVQIHCLVAQLVHRDDQHLARALERVRQALRLGEAPRPDPHASVGQVLCLIGVADADSDAVRRHPSEQPLDNLAPELAGRSSDDDQGILLSLCSNCVIAVTRKRVSLETSPEAIGPYRWNVSTVPSARPEVVDSTATEGPGRARIRQRVVEAAASLLAQGGSDAVTTRAVATAAGVQPPAIYRFFGDKDGLLEAVAEHGYATFIANKQAQPPLDDPVDDLRAGWDLAVEFGLTNPALYALMYGEPRRGTTSPAFEAGMQILLGRIRRLAETGWLRVDESLAAALIHATARGAVLTWLSLPEERRDPALLTAMRESMVTAVTRQTPAVEDPGPAGAARALRAALPEQTALSSGEQALLVEWLDRLAGTTSA